MQTKNAEEAVFPDVYVRNFIKSQSLLRFLKGYYLTNTRIVPFLPLKRR